MASAREQVGETGLVKGLGLLDATTLVVGSMIGSGIFIVAADIARQVASPGLLIMTWLVTAVLTMIAALSYGELAAAFPQAGGQYVYLREAFGPLSGFLYGWTLFLVIQTGTIAAVAVAFAKFAGVFVPWISAENRLLPFLSSQQLVAIAVLVLLSWVNTRGVRTGAAVQNIFTFAKVAALLGLVGFGLALGRNSEAVARNFSNFWEHADWTITTVRIVGVAMVGALFSSDAWNNVTFTAGEIRNPRRNVPLALVAGVGIVSAIYIACNFVYYAMALDKLFFRPVARLDPVHHTPVLALVAQCVWACLLTLSGRYSDLLDYVIFAVLLFYILTIAGVFVLRRTRPGMERPYRALGYPVLPALYIVLAGLIEVLLLLYKPNYTWPGLIIVLLGMPVYFLWRRVERT